jgi:hypothetical protein
LDNKSSNLIQQDILAGAGIQTAALAFGGDAGTANTGATEEYDGNSLDNK